MFITENIKNLYLDDQKTGDCLLTPQRWCYQQWIKLLSSSQDDLSIISEVCFRILKMIPLIPMTMIACGIGFLGIAIKACMIHPKSTNSHQNNSSETILQDNLIQINVVNQTHSEQPLQITLNGSLKKITDDILVYVATFLEKSERLNLRTVSKKFGTRMTLPVFSSEFALNSRLWGAYAERSDPWNQIKAYMKLSKTLDSFLEYLARLIPGGPVAFDQIPYLEPDDASLLQLSDINKSIIRGKDKNNFEFFAIRLLNEVDQKRCALIFTKELRKFQQFNPWIQEKNSLWEKDTLKMTSETDLSYMLNLIQGTSYIQNDQRFNSSKYIKTLKLI